MTNVLGGLLLVVAAIAGLIGIGWLILDAVGAEWDYCGGGGDCIAGWKIGAGFAVAAIVAGTVGFGLLRRERHDSGSGERLT